jgi:hypothetical protein
LFNDQLFDIHHSGFVYAIRLMMEEATAVLNQLKNGKGALHGELFLIEDIVNPFFTENKNDFQDIESVCYEQLMKLFRLKMEDIRFVNKKLLSNRRYMSSQGYLKLVRMFMDGIIYQKNLNATRRTFSTCTKNSAAFIQGGYHKTFLDFDSEKRIAYGKLKAVDRYIQFLKDESRTEVASQEITPVTEFHGTLQK